MRVSKTDLTHSTNEPDQWQAHTKCSSLSTMMTCNKNLNGLHPFRHDQLLTPRNSRSLELFPDNSDAYIRSQFHQADLDTKTDHYTALSYVRGDPGNTVAVDCNGHRALVSKNLHSALI